MSPSAKKNAIEQRVEELATQWNEFAEDPEARMLRWLVDPDEARMIDVFIEVESDEAGETPDLFVRFTEAFEDPRQYGFALAESLKRQYEEDREGLVEAGVDATWQCPAFAKGQSDVEAFVQSCLSFREHYQETMTHFAAVITPESFTDQKTYQLWLRRLLRVAFPPNVRFVIVDDLDAPAMEELAEAEPDRVRSVKADLDMPAARMELVNSMPAKGPGSTFQRNFVALSNAAAKGDLAGVRRLAEAALTIATKHKWPHMQAAVHMVVGGALLGAGQSKDAVGSYRSASKAAAQAEEDGDPAGPRVVVTTRMAEGAALVSDGQFKEAAKVYEDTAPLAAKLEDQVLTIENWRMASYCYAQVEEFKAAWGCGQKALDVGEAMEEEDRPNTTLPYVGQGLISIGRQNHSRRLETEARKRMVALLGRDWEQQLEGGAAES